jgi:hypothetical protein
MRTACEIATADWKLPADDKGKTVWARDVATDLEAFPDGSRYLNFSSGEDESALRTTFGPRYERLAQRKQEYDPTTSFS